MAQQLLDRDLPVATTPEAATVPRETAFRAARGLRTWESLDVRRDGCGVRHPLLQRIGAAGHTVQ